MDNALQPVSIFTFVGDTSPAINFIISRKKLGAVDLTGTTVDFFIQNPQTGLRTNTGHTTCVITSASIGSCTYSWMDGDIPVEGIYDARLRVTYIGGKKETAPVQIEVASNV
jgi:hypothetical protein